MGIRQTLGRWFGQGKSIPKQPMDLDKLAAAISRMRGSYDAARNGEEYKNIWANADRYDADSANSKDVRHTLISRSRYEIANNGFTDGIVKTYATDLIGVGPSLRMQTGSVGLNQLVEATWQRWAKAIGLQHKLWTMAHAKVSDGESFGVIHRNPRVAHPIKLDVEIIEAEQCQSPWLPFAEEGYIDGIRFDEFGNPIWYEFLKEHPGSTTRLDIDSTRKVLAEFVLHWFKRRRPGQHRGIPELASTLNVGAAARRYRESHLAAAELASNLSLLMKTQQTADDADPVAPFSTMDVVKDMMAFLPAGWDPFQMKAEFPAANYENFMSLLINEQARPLSMPLNKAACNSAKYNYASGRLDHQTYHGSMNVDRADGDELVLDRLFKVWLPEAIAAFGWFGGNPSVISDSGLTHAWDWPKHQVADIQAEASANKEKLQSGQMGLHQLYLENSKDLEDEIPAMAQTFGVDEAEIRKRLLEICLPAPKVGGAPGAQELPAEPKPEPAAASINRILPHINGNGATNGKH